MWNCCGVTLDFQQFDIGLRSETRFSISFTLKGIGSFGNVERPTACFSRASRALPMISQHIAYISAGQFRRSPASIQKALSALRESGAVPRKMSDYFETEPVGHADQPWFLNWLRKLKPFSLLKNCCAVARRLKISGTFSHIPQCPRTLDLDILLFESIVLDDPCLIIPHPGCGEEFVLTPLRRLHRMLFIRCCSNRSGRC